MSDGHNITVEELFTEVSKTEAFKTVADHPRYKVIATVNTNMGPDEIHHEIIGMSWDHDMGVLRLETD